jgi:hypothetical protein
MKTTVRNTFTLSKGITSKLSDVSIMLKRKKSQIVSLALLAYFEQCVQSMESNDEVMQSVEKTKV